MARILLFIIISFPFGICSFAQSKHEIRAVWLTTNFGLDWPSRPAYSESDINRQKKELYQLLDQLKAAHFNMIFVQARIRGDVIYPSVIEPFSSFVKNGSLKNHDPLALVIEACHDRGMECHAWFVTYPLGQSLKNVSGKNSLRKKDFVKKCDGEYYLDPGCPETNDYLLSLISEIVSNYDIDGFHFDYIRYPEKAESFPDKDTYKKYGNGKSLGAWRRENINRLVYEAYDRIKELKPWVQVSSSVIGMYEKIPGNKRSHWTAYGSVFQDPADWLRNGKHDFIVPMMYYSGELFFPFVQNWKEHSYGRFVVPGIGLYRMDKKEGNWACDIITGQIEYSRENQVQGNVYFRARQLQDNQKNILSRIRDEYYQYPAQLPPFTWLDSIPPSRGGKPDAIGKGASLQLSWKNHPDESEERVCYSVYRSDRFPVDIEDPQNLVATQIRKNTLYIPIDPEVESGYYYVVTTSDRFHNESLPSSPAYFCTGKFEK